MDHQQKFVVILATAAAVVLLGMVACTVDNTRQVGKVKIECLKTNRPALECKEVTK